MVNKKLICMNAQEAIAKAEQELYASLRIADISRSPGMKVIHSNRCRWLSVIVGLAKKIANGKAVEVVRCKVCKQWGGVAFGNVCRRWSAPLAGMKNCTGPDDFCSYGERRTDGDL